MNIAQFEQDIPALGPFAADDIVRGVCRYLRNLGSIPLTEFKLPTNRRVDVMGLDKGGRFTVVEIKSSVADFRADDKWQEYLPYGDRFYFAVANGFPVDILPDDCGIMIADAYNAAILKDSPVTKLNAKRRSTQTLRFAQTAAKRLHHINDPSF